MAVNNKLKISSFAKDMGVKSKDLVEILASKGFEGKSASSTLEHNEISVILVHYLDKSTVSDIGAYLSSPDPATKAELKQEPEK